MIAVIETINKELIAMDKQLKFWKNFPSTLDDINQDIKQHKKALKILKELC